MSTQSFITWLRHPGSIVLIIALVLMFVAMSEQSRQRSNLAPSSSMISNTSPASAGAMAPSTSGAAKPTTGTTTAPAAAPSAGGAKMGGELPKIVRQFGAPSMGAGGAAKPAGAPSRLQAPDLGSLLGRLEDKVKAEPSNMGYRLLLAQTYNELGLGDKALAEVRAAHEQAPDNERAKLVLASILSSRDNKEGLNEAKGLLEELKSSSVVKQYLVAMYLGDTYIRMGDHEQALSSWKQALDGMPVTDNRRPGIEKRIADLSKKSS